MNRTGHNEEPTVQEVTPDELDQLRRDVDELRRLAQEQGDLLRQVRADFAHYRRQVEEERSETLTQARLEGLVDVLDILDELQRLLAARPDLSQTLAPLDRRIGQVLAAEGVRRIEALGQLYNPWEHEAVQYQRSPELEDHRILAVVRDGYRAGDRVIRPAQVIVARAGS